MDLIISLVLVVDCKLKFSSLSISCAVFQASGRVNIRHWPQLQARYHVQTWLACYTLTLPKYEKGKKKIHVNFELVNVYVSL